MAGKDSFESGFIAGWFEARGIVGQPTLEQIQAAISAFARFITPWRTGEEAFPGA